MVAFGVFGFFLMGITLLFRSGQTAGNQSFWLQKTGAAQRVVLHHMNVNLQKSSYPSTIVFPQKIIENSRNDFKVHVSSRENVLATACADVQGTSRPASQFLRLTEAFPERQKFEQENPASLTYHIYSLTKSGKILYHRYMESVSTLAPLYVESLRRTRVPPDEAAMLEGQELMDDVESVRVQAVAEGDSPSVIVEITCANPRSHTRRTERLTGVPNVDVVVHPFDPEW